jgi:hypothetical protein
MSRRSNAFQKLIAHIHEEIESIGGRVTESKSLLEENIDEPVSREVDVLIERKSKNGTQRIAVECRDRASPDDIQWIDSLIGKYRNLPVHRVIAVSASGFSKNAVRKAFANNIELRSLPDALATHWPDEFTKLGLAVVNHLLKVESCSIRFEPPLTSEEVSPDAIMRTESGDRGTLRELLAVLGGPEMRARFLRYFSEHFLDIFKTRADLEKVMIVQHSIPIRGFYVIKEDGREHEAVEATLRIRGEPNAKEVPLTFHDYEQARIGRGVISIEGLEKVHVIYTAQVTGEKQGIIFGEVRNRRKSEK